MLKRYGNKNWRYFIIYCVAKLEDNKVIIRIANTIESDRSHDKFNRVLLHFDFIFDRQPEWYRKVFCLKLFGKLDLGPFVHSTWKCPHWYQKENIFAYYDLSQNTNMNLKTCMKWAYSSNPWPWTRKKTNSLIADNASKYFVSSKIIHFLYLDTYSFGQLRFSVPFPNARTVPSD